MSIRLAKMLIYGAFYIIFWILIIWSGYKLFFRPAPVVVLSPEASAQPISVLGVNVFATSPGHDTFLAKIANTNADVAAQYFPFSFELTDASGTVLQSFPGASFLYGGEVKYVELVNEALSGAMSTDTISATGWTLDIPTSTVQWIASSSFGPAPKLAVQNLSTVIASSSVSAGGIALATGNLVDGDTAAFTHVFIVAIFKDASGNPIGASQTELDSIAPDQVKNFSVGYPAVAGLNLAATEVAAYASR